MRRFFHSIPKPVRAVLFHVLQWTWGLPQNVFGALVTLYRPVKSISNRFGFSLGSFIFMPEGWSEGTRRRLVVHEYGHTVQSLMLGPLYLLVVALPSVIWSKRYFRTGSKYLTRGIAYTDRFPENEADRLGEYATGESPRA